MTMESVGLESASANQVSLGQTAGPAPNMSVRELKGKFALAMENVYTTSAFVCLVLLARLAKPRQSVQMIALDMAHVPTDSVIANHLTEVQTVIQL